MGCNCRGSNSYTTTINRDPRQPSSESICQKVAKAQNSLPVGITAAGGIVLPTTSLPAHSVLTSNKCSGVYVEKILELELTLTSSFQDPVWKAQFLQKLGANITIGSIEATVKTMP